MTITRCPWCGRPNLEGRMQYVWWYGLSAPPRVAPMTLCKDCLYATKQDEGGAA